MKKVNCLLSVAWSGRIFKSAERIKEAKAAPVSSQSEAEIPPDNRRPPPPSLSVSVICSLGSLQNKKIGSNLAFAMRDPSQWQPGHGDTGAGNNETRAEWGIF